MMPGKGKGGDPGNALIHVQGFQKHRKRVQDHDMVHEYQEIDNDDQDKIPVPEFCGHDFVLLFFSLSYLPAAKPPPGKMQRAALPLEAFLRHPL